MYSKELEELIESVLADGEVTDQERAVLRKRAQACGEDPDEVMVVVEGRLTKMKKITQPANEKRGNVVKCPNCGAPIEAGAVKCAECGYVFTNVKSNSSAERFAKELAIVLNKHQHAYTDTNISDRNRAVREFITSFPIPNSKEDMLEFLVSMDARRRDQSEYTDAYTTKYNECAIKARLLFKGDKQIEELLANTSKVNYQAPSKKIIAWVTHHKLLIACIILFLFIAKPVYRFLATPIGDQNWYEVSEAIQDDEVEDVVSAMGNQTSYSIEKHHGEISSYIRKLVKSHRIEDAEDVAIAVEAIAPNEYVSAPLYDYFVEQDNTVKAERYKKGSAEDAVNEEY